MQMIRYIKKLFVFILMITLVFPLWVSPIYAAESKEGKTIRIGRIDYEGFFNQNEDGTYSGYGVDYLTEISKYTGWNYEYVSDDWESLLQQLKDGGIDFICHAQKTKQREEEYLFSKYSHGIESSVLYVRNDDERYFYNDFENFKGMKIAVLKESFQNQEFTEYAKKRNISFEFVEYLTSEESFQALRDGDVDAVAMGSLALRSDFKIVCRFGADPFYFMTGQMNQELINELDEAMGLIAISKPYFQTDTYQKYYGGRENFTTLFTREEMEYIKENPSLTVGLISSQPPLSYIDESGNTAGITMDLANIVSEKSGIQFEYEFLDIGQSGYNYLSNSDAKLVAGVMATEFFPLNSNLLVSDTLLDTNFVMVGRGGEKFDPNMEAVMALPKNYIADETTLNKKFPNFTFIKCADITECLAAILSGKADVMMQNRYVIQEALRNSRYASLEIIDAYQIKEEMKIVTLQENEILESIINKSIGAISSDERDGIIVNNTIARVYHQSLDDILFLYRVPLIIIGFLFILLLGMLAFVVLLKQRNLKRMEKKNQQLNEAVKSADIANEAKTQFLAKMSHDLRTPLNGILGIANLLKDRTDPEEIREDVEQIESSGKYLLTLINDTLDMSKIESGKMELHPAPVKAEQLYNDIILNAKILAAKKGVKLVLDLEPITEGSWKMVLTDAARINQIFTNVISNAIKYTLPGGTVTIHRNNLSSADNKIKVQYTIADTGIGMSKEFQEHIFEPFMQEGRDNTSSSTGTGLGLSIVKELVSMMGGTLDIKSEENAGTVVTIQLEYEGYQGKLEEKYQQEVDLAVLKNKRVLLCEDHPLNSQIAVRLLEKKEVIVEAAQNGQIGLDMFEKSAENYYDAVLMDIRMPIMNGIDATKRIKALDRSDAKKIPIIAMTANAFDDDREATKQAGMCAHLSKPIVPNELYHTLAEMIS